jgi:hypothetical protein
MGFDPKKPKQFDREQVIDELNHAQDIKVAITVGLLIVLILAVAGVFYLLYFSGNKKTGPTGPTVIKTPPAQLPGSTLPRTGDSTVKPGDDLSLVNASDISYGSRYKLDFVPTINKASVVNLPLSVKADVANYYDVARSIDLDAQIADLNTNGFATMDNPLGPGVNDYYSAYSSISKKNLPIYVTNDFLIYLYQNKLKEVFADIRVNAFYKDLWGINKAFFDLANTRYKKTRLKVGEVNSPVLESQRLEAAFFAVALELLKPRVEQISKTDDLNDTKFSNKESREYDFVVPDYLTVDVNKEVSLVLLAKKTEKSPVLLYQRNYKEFAADQQEKNAKLVNFKLSTHWFSVAFPLYQKSEECRNCSLDDNDWLINFLTANYIAKDFSSNQLLKNRWARIYKIISFFSGLRSDLTYLHYSEVASSTYGQDYDLDSIFSGTSTIAEKISKATELRDGILAKFNFSAIEGGLDRSDPLIKQNLGMRILQDEYWPDNYIFAQLTNDKTGKYTGQLNFQRTLSTKINSTACTIKNRVVQRCWPTVYDIVNLYKPVEDSAFFTENTAYENYSNEVDVLKDQLARFSTIGWHSNVYWSTLGTLNQALLQGPSFSGPVNLSTPAWQLQQNNSFLAAWLNLRLPEDKVLPVATVAGGSLSLGHEADIYLEPNERLIAELSANIKMIDKVLVDLKIFTDVDYSSKLLLDFENQLDKIKAIAGKEISGEVLDDSDKVVLSELIRGRVDIKAKAKTIELFNGGRGDLYESLDGIKLLVQVYAKKDGNILVIGPVNNFHEIK